MNFEGLIGQNELKQRLTGIVLSGNIGHAYVFSGPDGIGKMSFAKEFARMCMCTDPEEGCCCGKCRACTLNGAGNNTDLNIISKDRDKTVISVDRIREDIQDKIQTAPNFSARKIFIIEDADMMNESAQNSILKTLEEPPEYVMIIMLCANTLNLIDTIKSRVINIELRRNTDAEILERAGRLEETGAEINDSLLCAYADGIMGRVEDIFGNAELAETRTEISEILEAVLAGKYDEKVRLKGIINVKKKKYDFVFFTIMSILRDAMLISRYGAKTRIMNEDFRGKIVSLGRNIGYYRVQKALFTVDECYKLLLKNAIAELTVDNMLIKLEQK